MTSIYQENIEVRVKLSGLPTHTRETHRFNTWVDRGEQQALKAAVALAHNELNPPFLFLYGGPGLGKTHLALAIGWEFVLQSHPVAYYQVESLLDALRQGYRIYQSVGPGEFNPNDYNTTLNWVKKVSLLILDDFGAQKETEWAAAKLDEVVDYRYIEQLPMVVTSNTLDIPPRVLDRFREGTVVRLKGESYRGKKVRLANEH